MAHSEIINKKLTTVSLHDCSIHTRNTVPHVNGKTGVEGKSEKLLRKTGRN
jgi:hypothetical protein